MAERPAAHGRYRCLAREHGAFGLVMLLAAAVRAVVMLGYPPVMWFNDSFFYISDAVYRNPDTMRPEGYPFLLALLMPLHSLTLVSALQDLMGLGMGAAIYALLRRRGLPWWGATLCALPVLFNAYEMLLEHMLGSDMLFTFLVTMAIVALCWRDRPSWRVVIASGLALGCSMIVRSAGDALLIVVLLGLLARGAGWRRALALLGTGVVPVAGYMIWFHHVYGQYATSEFAGPSLYGRVQTFAECSKMGTLPADLRVLCDPRPPSQRPNSEAYIWDGGTPLAALTGPETANRFTPHINKITMKFAERAIESQPLSYARVVVHDTLRTFGWTRWQSDDTGSGPTFQFRTKATPVPYWATDYPGDASARAIYLARLRYSGPGLGQTRVVAPWATFVRAYQRFFVMPGTILGFFLLAGAIGVAARWRRWGGQPVLPWLVAVLLVVFPPVTSGFSYRYVAAAVPLACLAAGLAFAGDREGERRRVHVTGWLRDHGLIRERAA